MAVQKSRKSKSKKHKRRKSNTIFKIPTISLDKETGETHIRHFMTKTGFYKGRNIIKKQNKKQNVVNV